MPAKRDQQWWKERWVADYRAQLKSPAALKAFIDHKKQSYTAFAWRVGGELSAAAGEERKVSRQMIAYLANGQVQFCTPELAGAIESALDLPEHTLFSLVPKSRSRRQTVNVSTSPETVKSA